MRRRALLSLSALAFAGCLAPRSDELGVPTTTSDCPPVGDRMVCVPETDPERAPISLTADSRSVSPPETVTFTLENGAGQPLTTNDYGWTLWKRADAEWVRVAPDTRPLPAIVLDDGDSYEWTLTAEHALPPNPWREYDAWHSEGTVSGLGGGEYAFTVDGALGESLDRTIGFAVRFEVDAPGTELEPTARVTDSSRDGGTVTVRGDGRGEEENRAEFVLRRIDDGEDSRTVIPEQAAHDYRLRNTLPHFKEGVERVRYVERGHTTGPPFAVDEPYAIRYRGEPYEASANRLESE